MELCASGVESVKCWKKIFLLLLSRLLLQDLSWEVLQLGGDDWPSLGMFQ